MMPVLTFCQKGNYSYDKIVNRLSNKTWIIIKECENDSCYKIVDKTYYFFKVPESDDYRKDTLTLRYVTHKITYSVKTGKAHFESNVCNPTIGFFNSPLGNENFTPIYISGWGGVGNGEISFENDSEFVMSEHILKTNGKNESANLDKNIDLKSYFKLTIAPE